MLGHYTFFRFIGVFIDWNFQLSWQKFDIFIPVSANHFFSTRDRDVFLWVVGLFISSYLWCTISWNVGSGKNRRILLRLFMKDIHSIRIEVKEGFYARRVLYMEIRGQGHSFDLYWWEFDSTRNWAKSSGIGLFFACTNWSILK